MRAYIATLLSHKDTLKQHITPYVFLLIAGCLIGSSTPPYGNYLLGWIGYSIVAVVFLTTPKENIRSLMIYIPFFVIPMRLVFYPWFFTAIQEQFSASSLVTLLILIGGHLLLISINCFYGFIYARLGSILPARLSYQAIFLWLFFVLWDSTEIGPFPDNIIITTVGSTILFSANFYLKPLGLRFMLFGFSTLLAFIFIKYYKESKMRFIVYSSLSILVVWSTLYGIGIKAYRDLNAEYSERQPVVLLQDNQGSLKREFNLEMNFPEDQKLKKLNKEDRAKFNLRLDKTRLYLVDNASESFKELSKEFKESATMATKKPENWLFWAECAFCEKSDPLIMGESMFEGFDVQVDLVAAGYEHIGRDNKYYNAYGFYHKNEGYMSSYFKNILFPMREYIPLEKTLPILRDWFPTWGGLSSARKSVITPHPSPTGPVFITFICYEIIMDYFVDHTISQAKKDYPGRDLIMINPASDDVFGISTENYQHSTLARFQASRVGLPLLRINRFGFTEIIAPWGETLFKSVRNKVEVLQGLLPVKKTTFRSPE